MTAFDSARARRSPRVLLAVDDDWGMAVVRWLPLTIDAIGARSTGEAQRLLATERFDALVVAMDVDGSTAALVSELRSAQTGIAIVLCVDALAAVELGEVRGVVIVARPEASTFFARLDLWIDERARPSASSPIRRPAARSPAHESGRYPKLRISEPPPREPAHPALTPLGIRRSAALARARPARLLRIPACNDAVVVLARHADLVAAPPSADLLLIDPTEGIDEIDALCARTRSIVAVIVDAPSLVTDRAGAVARIRAERPDTPVLVLPPRLTDDAADRLAQQGFACAPGNYAPFELAERAATFVEAALLRADVDRRVLDDRAIDWGLTPAEAELVWLCSMILPRDRVKELFGRGTATFETHVRRARSKIGAGGFHEIGRIARS